jgi:hypothetical protein
MVDAKSLTSHIAVVPEDRLYGGNCTWGSATFGWRLLTFYIADESMQHARVKAAELNVKAKL